MLNDKQKEILLKGINPSRIATRQGGGGKSLSYLEAWDVKAHLIRVFGFGRWSANVLQTDLAFEEQNEKGQRNVGYRVLLELKIHSFGCSYTEAAVGSATLSQRGEAHDMAIKTAESDALKRAAINLGDQFGLSLYNNGATAPVVITTLDGTDSDD
jgi:recombination DNA repair RAD52 pathway protein